MKIKYCTIKQFKEKVNEKKIIGFGASRLAKEFVFQYPDIASKISFFVDNNKKIVGTNICFDNKCWEIFSPDVLDRGGYNADEYIVLIFSNSYKDIMHQCKEYKLMDTVECYIYPLMSDDFFSIYQKFQWEQERLLSPVLHMYKEMMQINGESEDSILKIQKTKRAQMLEEGKFIIPKVNFLVTTKCTLRCKNCIGMIPYLQGEHCEKSSVMDDMKNFFRCLDECTVVEIGGGEPFLYPDMEEILKYLISEKKVTYIRIPTNGTVIPSESVTKLLQNEKVSLYISNYGFDVITKRFMNYVKENRIRNIFCEDMQWIDAGGLEIRNKSPLQKMIEYYICSAGKLCKTVYNGRLYHCARVARIQKIDASIEDDSIKLTDDSGDAEMREYVKAFFMKTNCVGCDYCDLANVDAEIIKAGIQIT